LPTVEDSIRFPAPNVSPFVTAPYILGPTFSIVYYIFLPTRVSNPIIELLKS